MKKYTLTYTEKSVAQFMFYTLFKKSRMSKIFGVFVVIIALSILSAAVMSVILYVQMQSASILLLSLLSVAVLIAAVAAVILILRHNVRKTVKSNNISGDITVYDDQKSILANITTEDGKKFTQRIPENKIEELCLYGDCCYVFMKEGGVFLGIHKSEAE